MLNSAIAMSGAQTDSCDLYCGLFLSKGAHEASPKRRNPRSPGTLEPGL